MARRRAGVLPLLLSMAGVCLPAAAQGDGPAAAGAPARSESPPREAARPAPQRPSAKLVEPGRPDAPGPDAAKLADEIDRAVLAAIAEGKLPGGVVAIGRRDAVLFARAYGYRALTPGREATTIDTVYDLASLTKAVATATSVMVLVDEGKLGLDDRASKYVPELAVPDKEKITVRQLLTHTSGLAVETPVSDFSRGPDEALHAAAASKMAGAPGAAYRYSDLGFFVLGQVVERVSGERLDAFARERIFEPLGMRDTTFLPAQPERDRTALTEPYDGVWMRGVVHDPRARKVGGVAGHAGLFSTAQDLVIYAQMLLARGAIGGRRVLSERAVQAMTAPHDVPGGVRALGWDVRSSHSTNRGGSLSPRAFGHGGYTGTSLWIDPANDLFVLLLSDRVHPDGKGAVNPLAGRLADLAVSSFGHPSADPCPVGAGAAPAAPGGVPPVGGEHVPAAPCAAVELGVDVLAGERFARISGAHVALVTHDAGRSRTGQRTLDLLRAAPNVTLRALWAPEHGLGSDKDARLPDGTDEATGLPVFSLYGEHLEPTAEALAGVDTVVVDLQDAGSRYFTYASTLKRVMQVAAARGLRVVVLDRPNPIDATDVAGPVLTPDGKSFVNHHALPVRHGMTMGELALLFDAELHLGTSLDVVPMRGYRRSSYFDETGLSWVNPSPNLRSTDEALLYDGVGLLEGSNVSVGRGTAMPFEVLGAPYVDAAALAAEMRRASVSGVSFSEVSFTPESGPHRGVACSGVRMRVTDRRRLDPVRLGFALAAALRRLYPREWHVEQLDRMVADRVLVAAVEAGAGPDEVAGMWGDALAAFKARRSKYLLYK